MTAAPVDTHESTQPISAPIVAALEQAWADIRARHPEVPAAVIVLGAGSSGNASAGLKLGHFAALRWHHDTNPEPDAHRLPEVFIGGEGLRRGRVGVLGTLLHEAAHALADVRGIKDTSRQGRWHNARFKTLAEELGIEVTKDPRIGWSPSAVPDATCVDYAEMLGELGAALRLFRAVEVSGAGKSKTPPPCVCGCGRRVRVAPSVLAAGPIFCGVCETEFEPEVDDEAGHDGQS